MIKIPCQYAIVRFMPFIETGEFANVGIIMMAPKARYFGYQLLIRRYGRVTQFFDELDARLFCSAMSNLREELRRIHQLLKSHGFDRRYKTVDIEFTKVLFAEVIRPREIIVRFSEPRAILTEEPSETLKKLFAYYVERDFVTKEYRETVLEKDIRRILFDAQIGERFTRSHVGDDEYQVPFPFVEMRDQCVTKIIKPLNLGQDDSSKIIEHGGKWEFRVRELKKRHVLPERVLFAVEGPGSNDRRGAAYQEAVEILKTTGVTVLPYNKREEILEFAKNY